MGLPAIQTIRIPSPESQFQTIVKDHREVPWFGFDGSNGDPYFSVDAYYREMPDWLRGVYEQARYQLGQDPEVQNIGRVIDFLLGNMWPEGRPSYRPRPVINQLLRDWRNNLANLSDVKLNMEVRASDKDYKQNAKNLTRLLQGNYNWQRGVISTIFTMMHAMIGGVGWSKTTYSPVKDDVVYVPHGQDTIIPILGNLMDFQESFGAIEMGWRPVAYMQEKYPHVADLIQPEGMTSALQGMDRPWDVPEYAWNAMSPAMKDIMGGVTSHGTSSTPQTVPVCRRYEFHFKCPILNDTRKTIRMGVGNWSYEVAPGRPLYPYGRTVVALMETMQAIAYDFPNMHWHGWMPYTPLRLQPVPFQWSGLSEFRDLISINEYLNKTMADALHLLNLAVNQVLVTKEGSMADEAWNAYFPGMPGAKIKLINRMDPIRSQIDWFGPDLNALAHFPVIYQSLKTAFSEQAGEIDTSRMMGKKQMPSPDSFEEVREAQQGKYRLSGIFVEDFFNQQGRMANSDIIQCYDRKKLYNVLGSDGVTWEYFDEDPNTVVPFDVNERPFDRGRNYVKKFDSRMQAGTALPSQKRALANMAMSLFAQHRISYETFFDKMRAAGFEFSEGKIELTKLEKELQEHPNLAPPVKPTKKKGATP